MLHPYREHIPIYLAAVGPKNLELTGEIADGWLPVFFAPGYADELARPASRPAAPRPASDMDGFDVVPTVPLVVGDDVAACADPVRPYAALYVGGMGSREQNFYNDLARRMGYDAGGRGRSRTSTSPATTTAPAPPCRSEFVDATSLLGPGRPDRRAHGRLRRGRRHDAVGLALRRHAGGAGRRAADRRRGARQVRSA